MLPLLATHLNDDEDKYMTDYLFVNNQFFMADREGFEPSGATRTPLVFKTSAINRSTTCP